MKPQHILPIYLASGSYFIFKSSSISAIRADLKSLYWHSSIDNSLSRSGTGGYISCWCPGSSMDGGVGRGMV